MQQQRLQVTYFEVVTPKFEVFEVYQLRFRGGCDHARLRLMCLPAALPTRLEA